MQKFGMSGPFYHVIRNLYSGPSATIVAAGVQSNPIRLHKGTRQGCPLSLWNPCRVTLTPTRAYKGSLFGQEDMRVALFADDILIFTTSLMTDITAIQSIFDSFS